jgi:aspartokinase
MKTVASCVEHIIKSHSFLEEGLSRQIINYSALANDLQKEVSQQLKKPVKTGAIMMALRRYNNTLDLDKSLKLKKVINHLGDITLRSNLVDFTYKNSSTLIKSHSKILDKIKDNNHIFYTFTRGIFESNLIISKSESKYVLEYFINEDQIELQENLSAISIKLPKNNSKIPGLYYHIFKQLAWEKVALHEVISTTNEITFLVEDEWVDKAFSIIKNIKT